MRRRLGIEATGDVMGGGGDWGGMDMCKERTMPIAELLFIKLSMWNFLSLSPVSIIQTGHHRHHRVAPLSGTRAKVVPSEPFPD